jgi:hypothetical protein
MNSPLLDNIVNAVLYEGYILYPYRPSSKKNRRERFTFGRVYPRDYSQAQGGVEPCVNQTECLLQSSGQATAIEVTVRFLHPMWREVGLMTEAQPDSFRTEPQLVINGALHQSWQEATERQVTLSVGPLQHSRPNFAQASIAFPSSCTVERLSGEAAIRRRQEALVGSVEVEASLVGPDIFKVTVRVSNHTPSTAAEAGDQDAVLMRTFASTHTILHATEGGFISLLDPAVPVQLLANQCKNIGTWPVLVGDEARAEGDTMLSSPIILYDYPKVAPESPGSFFDGTEIDEMLTLRVLTMTDGEKLEMRQVDDYARRILERTEATGAAGLMRMHGVMRETKAAEEFFNATMPVQHVVVGGRKLCAGTSVRLRPKNRADAIDMILEGKTALIEAIEQDAEGKIHLAVVLDDDPGKDLGMARQPGHRFFYGLDEVEPIAEAAS